MFDPDLKDPKTSCGNEMPSKVYTGTTDLIKNWDSMEKTDRSEAIYYE